MLVRQGDDCRVLFSTPFSGRRPTSGKCPARHPVQFLLLFAGVIHAQRSVCIVQHRTDFINRPCSTTNVDYSVTVGAHRSKVVNGIDGVFGADLGQRCQVVNVNETVSFRAEYGQKN
jgi:hypothetical protein